MPQQPRKGRLIGHANAKAIRAKNKKAHAAYKASKDFVAVGVHKDSFDEGLKVLQRFPFEMQRMVIRKAGRAAAIVVRETANTMLELSSSPRGPDEGKFPGNSIETKTFERKSKEQQDARMGRPSMVDKVGIKPMALRNGYLHMVGPRRPWGNQAWILEWGGVIELWGTGTYYHLRPRPFMEPAGQNTVRQQGKEYVDKMKTEWANW